MITLLGTLLGFLGSAFPEFIKLWKDASDKKHEINLLHLQMQLQAQEHSERLEEINTQGDIAESMALYKTYTTNIGWVDALNGTVRPIIAYAFFLLYAGVKCMAYAAVANSTALPFIVLHDTLWTQDDAAIFAGIMAFYFGQRGMRKLRK